MKGQESGFDTDKYLYYQSKELQSFINSSSDRLYIEVGGKIINDKHSARVLPGYREDTKFELIKKFYKKSELIFVVSSQDIIKQRIRGDFQITYDLETIRLLKEFKNKGVIIKNVVLSLLDRRKEISPLIKAFENKLKSLKVSTYRFYSIDKYQYQKVNFNGYQINPFIKTQKKLVFIISPGGGSGKFGICLSQLYHELKSGNSPRYLKFETFPVHDLPVSHPLNIAYMAAAADFYDVVLKDKRHGRATSYQRDLDNYELLRQLARKFKERGRHLRTLTSATHMGINMISKGIINDEVVQREAAAEIARRLIRYKFEVQRGQEDGKILNRVREVLKML